MRDIEDLHHAEDQRQPDRDDEQIGRVDQAVDQNGESGQHRNIPTGQPGGAGPWPLDEPIGRCSALRAFHAFLDPVVGIDAGRRVHALGGKRMISTISGSFFSLLKR